MAQKQKNKENLKTKTPITNLLLCCMMWIADDQNY